jgi:acetoin utilization protein AcuB
LLGLATVTDVLEAEVRSAMGPTHATEAIAADVMTPWPFTVRSDTSLPDAAAIMIRRRVRHLPVVDATSTIVGIVSERDIRTVIGDPVEYRSRSLIQPSVADAMTSPAITVAFDTPLVEVGRKFADTRIGAVPVVDKFGALIGIVSYIDALRVLAG